MPARLPARPPGAGALLSELALAFRRLLPGVEPQSLAMALHAYATLGFTPHELLDGAAEHMAARLGSYPPQSAATVVWAFAKLGLHPGRGLPGGGVLTDVRARRARRAASQSSFLYVGVESCYPRGTADGTLSELLFAGRAASLSSALGRG